MKKNEAHYKSLDYPVAILPDPEGGYVASHPDLPGCVAFGETREEAMRGLDEMRELWIDAYYESHGQCPEPKLPSQFSGKLVVRMPTSLHERLDHSARAEGVSLNQYIVSLLSERDSINIMKRMLSERQQPSTVILRQLPAYAGIFASFSATRTAALPEIQERMIRMLEV